MLLNIISTQIRKSFQKPIGKAAFLSGAGLMASLTAFGGMPDAMYNSALQAAQKKVERTTSVHSNLNSRLSAMALSSGTIKTHLGRYYQVGDSWDVLAWQFNSTMMRRLSDPKLLQKQAYRAGMFHYEVVDVKAGKNPEVTIQVTQTSSDKFKPIDSRVARLELKMNDRIIQSAKKYFFTGNNEGVPVSPEGLHENFTPLELFPLDVPDIVTAKRDAHPQSPELPPRVKEMADTMGFKLDMSKTVGFEQDDFFGRPVHILWQQGDPWPAYFQTPGGIAILIHKGNL